MRYYRHSKSGLFLMELMMNLLLFCLLCGFGLLFFIKSHNLINDATTLHHAVRITSSVADIFESGDGSFYSLSREYPDMDLSEDCLFIYFDKDYYPCKKSDSVYYVLAEKVTAAFPKIRIDFYTDTGDLAYSIRACNYSSPLYQDTKEVSLN